jgi:hypothetical protein
MSMQDRLFRREFADNALIAEDTEIARKDLGKMIRSRAVCACCLGGQPAAREDSNAADRLRLCGQSPWRLVSPTPSFWEVKMGRLLGTTALAAVLTFSACGCFAFAGSRELEAGFHASGHAKCKSSDPLVYVSTSEGVIQVFAPQASTFALCYKFKPGRDARGGSALYVDQSENLWVMGADTEEFAKGATKPERILSGSSGSDMVVDTDGAVYIANRYNIEVYAGGSNSPTSQLNPGCQPYAIALDNAHDLYAQTGCGITEIGLVGGQTWSINPSIKFGWFQTTASGVLAGYSWGICGTLAPVSLNWTPVFTPYGDVVGFKLFRGEQTAIVPFSQEGAGGGAAAWNWSGSGEYLFTIANGSEEAEGVAVSPPDPLGRPFHSFK